MAHSPPLDVLREIVDRIHLVRDVVAFASASSDLLTATALRRRAYAYARHGLRVRLRAARTALAHRKAFVQCDTGRMVLVSRAAAIESIVVRLERAPHGLHDLLAATQKALAAVESQSLVAPSRVRRLRDDLTHLATLACLLAWRASARERQLQAAATQAAAEPLPPWQQLRGGEERVARLVSRAVQTEDSLTLGDVRELVAAFRSLADSSNASTKLCLCTLNLMDFYLSREVWDNNAAANNVAAAAAADAAANAAAADADAEAADAAAAAAAAADAGDGAAPADGAGGGAAAGQP